MLVVPFAFFGMEQYLFQNNDNYAAKIEAPPAWWPSAPAFWPVTMLWQRDEIGVDEFHNQFQQARQQQRAQQGDAFDATAFESIDNKRKVLDTMIDQRVLRMAADRSGIAVGDAQVREQIESIPAFQVGGKFNAQQYQLMLQSQIPPRSPRQFQEDVRESLKRLVPTQVAESSFLTDAELDRLLRLTGETRDVGFVVMNPPAADTAPVTDAQVQAWYAAHAASYRAPETVTLEYVEAGRVRAAVPAPTEEALRQRFQQQQAHAVAAEPAPRLAHPGQGRCERRRSGVEGGRGQGGEDRGAGAPARRRFRRARARDSDDDGSKAAGGDLGWVERARCPSRSRTRCSRCRRAR